VNVNGGLDDDASECCIDEEDFFTAADGVVELFDAGGTFPAIGTLISDGGAIIAATVGS
jgi:hypothetical protein